MLLSLFDFVAETALAWVFIYLFICLLHIYFTMAVYIYVMSVHNQVVCVENNIELLGLGKEEVVDGAELKEHKPRGFRMPPTTVQTR